MIKLLSAIGILAAGVFLFGSCTKSQNYGGTATEKVSNGWWALAYSSVNGPITPASAASTGDNYIFFTTYNTSGNTPDSVWVDDLGYIGAPYDVKAEIGVNLSTYTLSSSGTVNLYDSSVTWASGKVFPKGGLSRTGVVTDSIHIQFLLAGDPGDTLTIQGVARTGFDGDDWPASPYTPTP
jgi:hypothetical protein